MPACTCPHCRTNIWVKDTQLNLAQGFVVCHQCEGVFKAASHLTKAGGRFQAESPPAAATDARLVRNIGAQVRRHKQLSRNEIADLLDGITLAPKPEATARGFNWHIACAVAAAVLLLQLVYLALLV